MTDEDRAALEVGRVVMQAARGLRGPGRLTVHVRPDGLPAAVEVPPPATPAQRVPIDLAKVLDLEGRGEHNTR